MYNPVSTYRIQFHKGFTFSDFEMVMPYFVKLGVSTIYASPIFKAVPGSTHGYDCVDPLTINPEIGTEEQLRSITKKLKGEGIGWMQDIVPNHMAFHQDNLWLMDVLEKGHASEYASFFDIDWREKLMVPFLGSMLGEVIQKGELKVSSENNRLVLKYYGSTFPLSRESYSLDEIPERINKNADRLAELLANQHYRLCHWQETDKQINYRRFFTINGLISLNIQDENVSRVFHGKIKELVLDGVFDGLRIDHIDGLSDPVKYLDNLRELVGNDIPIVVEKILEPEESLPAYWPVNGTTGYDFLSLVNNLLTNRISGGVFTKLYKKFANDTVSVRQQIYNKKAHILFEHMSGDLDNLYRLFNELQLADDRVVATIGEEKLKAAIAQLLIQCPVYRYYGNSMPLQAIEEDSIRNILASIKEQNAELIGAAHLLEEALLVKTKTAGSEYNDRALRFYQRCMQFAGPLMAKGVEDTLMYTYHRFIGHNDVGDAPGAFGITQENFHRAMIERQIKWPMSLNATATHDTKRGEDVRARLNVLTDMAEEWEKKVKEWRILNAGLKKSGWPDSNDEYFIYQVLAGMYPFEGQDADDILPRLEQYIEKALREAKVYSTWTEPHVEYEEAAKKFIAGLLDQTSSFWKSFSEFQKKLSEGSIVNSLVQVMLKFTCPGIPDTYQGTELWDLSLVDPDNRRPVDYALRHKWLESVNNKPSESLISDLWETREDGRIKLWLTHLLLHIRKEKPNLLTKGRYIPLEVKGKFRDHVFAFARRHRQSWFITVVPVNMAGVLKRDDTLLAFDWKDTRVVLPDEAPQEWQHIFTKEKIKAGELHASDIFKQLPLAMLNAEISADKRSAGILLAISSLPSDYGVGDFGTYARRFANFLSRSHQKYWQMLPLNPTDTGSGHSPYSSVSSMAGNTLLLSPELIAKAGFLDPGILKEYHLAHKDSANYDSAEKIKRELFDIAYANYKAKPSAALAGQFADFCDEEAYWLNDFALYTVLKDKHENKPWHQWPGAFKLRDMQALAEFERSYADEINKIKWLQFLFSLQWKELKTYCNDLGVRIFGDMPFYVSYDSADVWANPEIFCLDSSLDTAGMAGVPPDYFSEDGQLWGMPTFNWNILKQQNYHWWVNRLKKNLELFDLVRLDHFRAFAEYWQVPAGELTARNGEWKPGPGKEFFDVIEKELGGLPFVAEDLGDNMAPVYALRDQIGLPGMRVLQFAFSEQVATSVDAPHNYTSNSVVYTGTHDNNTTLGWYQQEANRADHKRLEEYNGTSLREKDVHFVLVRMAYSSVADIAIIPMQDILGLGEHARMNTPGLPTGNWTWRLKENQLIKRIEKLLRKWTAIYRRY